MFTGREENLECNSPKEQDACQQVPPPQQCYPETHSPSKSEPRYERTDSQTEPLEDKQTITNEKAEVTFSIARGEFSQTPQTPQTRSKTPSLCGTSQTTQHTSL